jgi:hypothetical protein
MRSGGARNASGLSGMSARHGQASVELVAIMGAVLLVLLVFFTYASSMLSDINTRQNTDDARSAVLGLAAAADAVYAQGEGAAETVRITLPTNTEFGADKTYIGAPSYATSPANTLISIRLSGNDISASTKAPLSGSFPPAHGTYLMNVVSRGAYVQIYRDIVDVEKHSVYASMGSSDSRKDSLFIFPTSSENVSINVSFSWPTSHSLAHATVDIDSVDFVVGMEGHFIGFTFITEGAPPGLYSSNLSFVAKGARTNLTENFTIPVTMVVSG